MRRGKKSRETKRMQSIFASLAAVAIITISCLRDTSCIWCNQKGTTTNISGDEKCGSIMFRPASTQPVKRQRCSLIELLSYLPNKITGRKDNDHRSSEKVQPDDDTHISTRDKKNEILAQNKHSRKYTNDPRVSGVSRICWPFSG